MMRAIAVLSLGALVGAPLGAQTLVEVREAVRSGEYDDASEAYRDLLDQDASSYEARRGLVQVLMTTGEYEEAERIARDAPTPVGMANTLGEVLVVVGKLDEADAAFRRSMEGNASDALTAEVNLAELLFSRGDLDEAMRRFDRFIDVYNGADGALRASGLAAVGRAVAYLGRNEPQLFQDALRAFDEAAAADPGWHEPSVWGGRAFSRQVLQHPSAGGVREGAGDEPASPGRAPRPRQGS
jgi:tetratricopeptide (TPR) repeat protein